MNRTNPPCCMCANFTIAGHEEAASRGKGWCSAWEAYKPWNGQIGVLFKAAKDESRRRTWAEKQEAISRASAS